MPMPNVMMGAPTMDSLLRALEPKAYINGFPKSGTHLAELMILPMLGPAEEPPWLGNLGGKGWLLQESMTPEEIGRKIAAAQPGTYYKGHLYYRDEISRLFTEMDVAKFLVVRDMRDVVVSQAHHVTSDDDRLAHLDKDLYRALPSFEDVLIAVIEGIGEYPGIFKRWMYFAGWLEHPRVYLLRFEDMRYKAHHTALNVAYWLAKRTAERTGLEIDKTEVRRRADAAVDNMGHRERATTFRQGKSGGWRDHFTGRVVDSFKANSAGWLQWMGYEEDDQW